MLILKKKVPSGEKIRSIQMHGQKQTKNCILNIQVDFLRKTGGEEQQDQEMKKVHSGE